MNKNITTNELQAKISTVLKDVQAGHRYEVMRYSEPVAVVLSYKDFLSMKGECKRCMDDIREVLKNTKEDK